MKTRDNEILKINYKNLPEAFTENLTLAMLAVKRDGESGRFYLDAEELDGLPEHMKEFTEQSVRLLKWKTQCVNIIAKVVEKYAEDPATPEKPDPLRKTLTLGQHYSTVWDEYKIDADFLRLYADFSGLKKINEVDEKVKDKNYYDRRKAFIGVGKIDLWNAMCAINYPLFRIALVLYPKILPEMIRIADELIRYFETTDRARVSKFFDMMRQELGLNKKRLATLCRT